MQLAQKQEAESDKQPAQKQSNGAKMASPRGGSIAQLEALTAGSPRLAAQGAMAAQLAASPAMAQQSARMGAIQNSPRNAFQLKQVTDGAGAVQMVEEEEALQGKFEPAQLVEDEEPMQGKFEAAQLVEEEEPLQGKFEAAQLVEDEEPLQGKFEAAQLVEEEEPLQGKFEAAQLVEEEEPLQGKFEAAQLVEEEEPLQGKFEAAQLVEEEEPLQGKFEAAQLVEEEEPLQGKFEAAQLVEEEEPLQGKFEAAQLVEEEEPLQGKAVGSGVAQREEAAAAPNKTGLPDTLKSGIENMSGMSMDHVKVHYNSSEPAQLNAHAFAQGSDIHVAPGQEQHLPHEAWHVVQQAQGRVQPTKQMKKGTPVNDDKGLETEADVMGDKAMETGQLVQAQEAQLKEIGATSGTAQLNRGRSGSVSGSAPGPSAEMTAPSEMQTEEWTDFDDSMPASETTVADEELQPGPTATPEERSMLSRAGPGLKVGVEAAGSVAGGVKDAAGSIEKAVNPVEKGAELFASSNSVFGHIKDAAVGVVGKLVSPIAAMVAAGLGMKTKWAQWTVFDETSTEVKDGKKVAKADAPPEAVYALTKAPAGFMKYVKDMFMGVFNFVKTLAAIIPGGQFIAGPMAVFDSIVGLVDKLYKAGKKLYQFFKGEKKDTNATTLLQKAMGGDSAALTLILRLKLPSICGTGISLVDRIQGRVSAAASGVMGRVTGSDERATRIIDLMKPGGGGPTSESELLEMLNLIRGNSASVEVLRNDIKTTMTGYGV